MHNRHGQDKFDDQEYWKSRHSEINSLEASGLQSVGLTANFYIYKMLEERYLELLDRLSDEQIKCILDCGYGDGYFLRVLRSRYPKASIVGIDASAAAREKVDFLSKKDRLLVGDLTKFNLREKFDLVHCFDVLYHILDEAENYNALVNLAMHSNMYVILHERFLSDVPYITSRHVRMRRSEVTDQALNSQGFYLYTEIPTHFLAMTLFTFKLNKFMPKMLYRMDKWIASHLSSNVQERLATHWIRVYRKS